MFRLLILVVFFISACAEGKHVQKPTLTAACDTEYQIPIPVEDEFTVLVWNIHDRAHEGSVYSNEWHTEGEITCIAEIAKRYDLVLFQEAFIHPQQIAHATEHPFMNYPAFQEGGGGNWWPLRWLCEICRTPGLLALSSERPLFVYAEPYTAFIGLHTKANKSDSFFSKGLQLIRFPAMWVLNSHNDAGRGDLSVAAREKQFRQITRALYTLVPPEAPLLIGMDANLRPDHDPRDGVILAEFLRANQLTLIQQHGPDLIAVRNMTAANPQVLSLEDVLSDHDALSVVVP